VKLLLRGGGGDVQKLKGIFENRRLYHLWEAETREKKYIP
jgi:hypothetical protein